MSLTDLTGVTMNDIVSFIIATHENPEHDDFDWMDYPITVAFKDRDGMTVLSDITSVSFNGKSIQLNEEKFDKEMTLAIQNR